MTDTGRSGKVRLERRLLTAKHGAALLDRKQHIMADELERLQLHADGIRQEWEERAREAAMWLGRAAGLDGRAQIEAASPSDSAEVEIRWGGAMGVTYPEEASCRLPGVPLSGGSSALAFAAIAHRSALTAAVQHAVVQRAVLLLSTELTATRTRQRAVENRWIPLLEDGLRAIRRALEDQELEESLRVRWAADRTEKPVPRPRVPELESS
ncbi:V-type ATP synthase subunit D [Cryobacterium sp. PH29-G1]|uniref:V-type ATP synthase subunit D n=1 Tax=Cryobacterium sp. PH29-G1 TaxID=3046211 RepID=UPI0024B9322D|nr:V-type ATP synthase subunit D [Cryobacterium sp. PH29-G1]MDJ0348011.1 V-type ATP synthase subunit D [Cryobacterium sp. PH29-G1]